MDVMDYLRITPLLNKCPHCGHGQVGTNDSTSEFHGALLIEDNLFTRKCRCGFEITIDSKDGTSKKILKVKINEELKRFKEHQS